MPRSRSLAKHSSSPPGWGVLLSFMYCRRRRTRCTFSAVLTTWNQVVNARISSRASVAGRPWVRTTSCTQSSASPMPAADGGLPVALHRLEERVAALVPEHLADEPAERMHVVAQRRVLDRENDAFAGHGRRVMLVGELKRVGVRPVRGRLGGLRVANRSRVGRRSPCCHAATACAAHYHCAAQPARSPA